LVSPRQWSRKLIYLNFEGFFLAGLGVKIRARKLYEKQPMVAIVYRISYKTKKKRRLFSRHFFRSNLTILMKIYNKIALFLIFICNMAMGSVDWLQLVSQRNSIFWFAQLCYDKTFKWCNVGRGKNNTIGQIAYLIK